MLKSPSREGITLTDIQQRIAKVLGRHRLTVRQVWANEGVCGCGESVRTFPPGLTLSIPCHEDHLAQVIIAELGLAEFECGGDRWWSTKFYPHEG